MERVLAELQEAARLMNAPAVNQEQRKQAESLLLKFKKSDKPYPICKSILENTDDPYLHFLASSTLKEGVMREWALLGENEIDQLRDYLLNYAHTHLGAHAYVLRQMLHVVALIVKRSILTRDSTYLDTFTANVCCLFKSAETLNLGLEIASALIAEFTVADKTLSSYMSYQHNLDCKKAIEGDALYKIFLSTLEVINHIQSSPVAQHRREWIKLMAILHSILSWDFGVILSKRLAQMSSLSLPVVNLMPGVQWAVLKEEKVLALLVELHATFSTDRLIQHTTRHCIVQLGTLQGSIFNDQNERVTFLSRYIAAIVKLATGACSQQSHDEDHGIALAIRQLLWANTCQDLDNVHAGLFREFLGVVSELSVKVILNSAKEDADEGGTQDVVDVILDIWYTLLQMMDTLPRSPLDQCMLRVVECYVKCHLAPPTGIRNDIQEMDEIDVDTEEDDRVKFRDQLEIVGSLARVNLETALPHYTALLLERARVIRKLVENQEECTALYEDIHWIVLLIGYTLADAPTDSDLTIPATILDFLAKQDVPLNVESTQAYIQTRLGQCADLPTQNHVIAPIFALLELSSLYQDILSKGGSHNLSPQVFSSLMWSLTRIMSSYHMPNERDYQFIPTSVVTTFGVDSSIGGWLVGFLVEKIISGLVYYSGEQSTVEDCMSLLQSCSKNSRISLVLMKDDNFQKLVGRYTTGVLVLPSSKANRMFSAALTIIMSHLPSGEHQQFMDRVFGPIRDSTVKMLFSTEIAEVPGSPVLTQQVLTALDTFHGIAAGIVNKIVDVVFNTVIPILEGSINLMKISQHIQPITRSILELFCAIADSGILQIDKTQTHRLYDTCYKVLKCYSDSAASRQSLTIGVEDDRYDNILLCLELLSHLCSKDFFNFDEPDSYDETSSRLVLVGLDIIVPHIDVELLKFPKLSNEFFKLITFICEVYPEKVVSLPESVVDQIVLMLKVGLNNYNDDITFYIFNAVSALSVNSANNPPFQKKIGQIIKHTLLLISGQELSAELYDTAADMVFSFICKCRGEYLTVVNEIVVQQEDPASQECLRTAFSALIPATPSTTLTRRDKGKFSKIFENFAVNVYGICR